MARRQMQKSAGTNYALNARTVRGRTARARCKRRNQEMDRLGVRARLAVEDWVASMPSVASVQQQVKCKFEVTGDR
jgi:hypothetical protein